MYISNMKNGSIADIILLNESDIYAGVKNGTVVRAILASGSLTAFRKMTFDIRF